MTVYCLFSEIAYEGSDLVGVFSTMDKAKERAENGTGRPINWRLSGDNRTAWGWASVSNSAGCWQIDAYEVDSEEP